MASDLGLHVLPMFHKNNDMLISVNTVEHSSFCCNSGLNVGDLLRIRPVKPGVKPPGETDEEDDDDNCIAQLDDEVFADLSEAFVQLKDKLQLVEEIFATLKPTVSEAAVDELMSLESDIKAIAAETEAKIMGAKGM